MFIFLFSVTIPRWLLLEIRWQRLHTFGSTLMYSETFLNSLGRDRASFYSSDVCRRVISFSLRIMASQRGLQKNRPVYSTLINNTDIIRGEAIGRSWSVTIQYGNIVREILQILNRVSSIFPRLFFFLLMKILNFARVSYHLITVVRCPFICQTGVTPFLRLLLIIFE